MTKQHIGIIGAGQMGQGIAELFWYQGHAIYLFDSDPMRLELAYQNLIKHLEIAIDKGIIPKTQWDEFLDRLYICVQLSYMSPCTWVIEAIVEDMSIKEKLFSDLSKIVDHACILSTNTSSFSITELARHVVTPSRFLGVHFFNPVHRMPLVEVIPHSGTSDQIAVIVVDSLKSLNKTPILCNDSPGFIVNRLLIPLINQAARLAEQNVATPDNIDVALKLGANFPMGPLALADFIGLDTCVSILNTLAKDCNDTSYLPAGILLNYVEDGKLGVKSKEGFFKYA